MSTRSLTVWNTTGNNRNDFESSARTLEELLREFSQHGISHNNMSIVVGETQATLESKHALLPEGNTTIFLFQKKVKSGAIDKAAILKTFSKSNKEAKLRIAKKNGYNDIESFRSFLQGKGSKAIAKSTAKSPVKPSAKPSTPTKSKHVHVELPKAVKKSTSHSSSTELAPTKQMVAPTPAKVSDEELRRTADTIRRAMPY